MRRKIIYRRSSYWAVYFRYGPRFLSEEYINFMAYTYIKIRMLPIYSPHSSKVN